MVKGFWRSMAPFWSFFLNLGWTDSHKWGNSAGLPVGMAQGWRWDFESRNTRKTRTGARDGFNR